MVDDDREQVVDGRPARLARTRVHVGRQVEVAHGETHGVLHLGPRVQAPPEPLEVQAQYLAGPEGASDAWVAVVSRRDLGSINIAGLSLYAGILADGKLFGGLLPHAAGGAQVPLAILQLLDPGEEPQTVCVSQNA